MFREVERGQIMKGYIENNFDFNLSVKVSQWRLKNKREI